MALYDHGSGYNNLSSCESPQTEEDGGSDSHSVRSNVSVPYVYYVRPVHDTKRKSMSSDNGMVSGKSFKNLTR